ncbi:MAG TPA: 50S ribosomal protein L4 [Longimicrobiales bacterium]|nr:50S ribosomal protein L4 [Longimicrobiales bacterium]
MYKAPVITAEGEKTGDRELPEVLFDGTVHEAAMWQVVKAYLANQRQATAATKTRSEVTGGNRKPWRQKGTGRARQGSIRAPQWRGGGSVFGPRANRNFKQDVPKQVKWLARRSAYNVRAQDGGVFVVDAMQFDVPQTKRMLALMAAVGVAPKTGVNVLVLTDGHKPLLHRSARNIPGVQVRPFGQESAYDLLWADTLIIEAPALERAQEVAHA